MHRLHAIIVSDSSQLHQCQQSRQLACLGIVLRAGRRDKVQTWRVDVEAVFLLPTRSSHSSYLSLCRSKRRVLKRRSKRNACQNSLQRWRRQRWRRIRKIWRGWEWSRVTLLHFIELIHSLGCSRGSFAFWLHSIEVFSCQDRSHKPKQWYNSRYRSQNRSQDLRRHRRPKNSKKRNRARCPETQKKPRFGLKERPMTETHTITTK